MAYNDSGDLQPNSTYALGGYSFELKVQTVHEPGEPDVVSVFAICRGPDGTRETVPMDFPEGTEVESWSVEANETEASVYVLINNEGLDISPMSYPVTLSERYIFRYSYSPKSPLYMSFDDGTPYVFAYTAGNRTVQVINASKTGGAHMARAYNLESGEPTGAQVNYNFNASFTHNGQTAYYRTTSTGDQIDKQFVVANNPISGPAFPQNVGALAWMMLYGESTPSGEREELVARFAIDLREADGGPDGDWDEPGDVGPDPEKHFTLTVSVAGASAGSNNGTPLEAGQAGGYGNGGTGGNGGGGGAGASTVIIYEFATNKADNVVQEATAQGPGTGGPGGKGGKGGDGCILIFY